VSNHFKLALAFVAMLPLAPLTARGERASENAVEQFLIPEGAIALPDTGGRIDHMAIDLQRKRLFVAELGNGTLDVVDLINRKVLHRFAGLKEPQGIVYDPKSDLIAVACGGDGTLRFFSGQDFAPRGVIALGADADNARIDPGNGRILVGYGEGALAIVEPSSLKKLAEIPLSAHPESFQLSGDHVFINVPDAGEIVLAELESAKVLRVFKPTKLSSNFPMILDDSGHPATVFRAQSKLALLDGNLGTVLATAGVCDDADDLFFDAPRKRFYVSCGAGKVDVVAEGSGGLNLLSRVPTKPGARTSLFVPELGRLFVAARVGILGSDASILVFRTSAD
jgi:DNA-binding beta-propeller fold protein YncE